ncbi:MAG: zinc ribbon domain-containing protein [Candidatus Krumholzibacteriota bacterium]|nr:zinc ribbon domain-containing protein [Candidatus Krumholzibacteriota bacterium]
MSTSTGKTIGLAALIIIVALTLWTAFRVFIFGPFGIITHDFLGIPSPGRINMGWGMPGILGRAIPTLILFIVWIGVSIWVYRDAEERGKNGVLWALLVFLGNIVGLIIYLIIRNENGATGRVKEEMESCPGCAKPLPVHFTFCPHCGTKLHLLCPGCRRKVQAGWKICPDCETRLSRE